LFSHRSEAQRTEAYGLASSLAAAALDGHFEHPASRSCDITIRKITVNFEQKLSFSAAC
jgi:hypothetical protein